MTRPAAIYARVSSDRQKEDHTIASQTAALIQYAETDERINAMWPAFEAALKAAGVPHQMHRYPGTQHGFHNNSTPRYNEAAAKLAWERTIAFFKKNLA